MKLYTTADLSRGAGVFDHVMGMSPFPSRHGGMPAPVAVGIVAAAMKSGLKDAEIDEIINGLFAGKETQLLRTVRSMYEGEDQRIHLWKKLDDGTYQLDPSLRYYTHPSWRIDRDSHHRCPGFF